jgi:calpain-7
LQNEVGYDPIKAAERDDGVFWICWEDVLVYFSKINLSWNPSLFSSKVNVHGFWPANQGPANDSFNVSENPQYILTISDEAIQSKSTLWILLSRHVDKYEQEGEEVSLQLFRFVLACICVQLLKLLYSNNDNN